MALGTELSVTIEQGMKMKKLLQTLLGTLVLGLGLANAGFTQEPVKIGMVTTLSTGGGYLGQDVRDGFLLAVEEEGGKLGGVPVEVLVEDDGRNPVNGRQIVKRFLDRDRICLLYTSPSPRDKRQSRMPSSA